MYNYYFHKKVVKFLESKDKNFVKKVYEKIDILAKNPYKNELDISNFMWRKNTFRLRIWKYRFLYEIIEDKILIFFFDADSRWDIYKNN